jgi:predicted RNase H-like HicB family nuclease
MQNLRTHFFNEGPVVTGLLAPGEYVAFEPDREEIKGHGDTELSAIADLNRAIAAVGEDRDDDERPLTGQNVIEARWDHERDLRKHEAA